MLSSVHLGAIADDFTGASDLAGMMSREGARTGLFLDKEAVTAESANGFDAVVVALKTRSIPVSDARRETIEAMRRLRQAGARQIYFKYCSTFDSSREGNIGPVTEALMQELDVPFTIAVPSLPVNGRTQYFGYLFVGGRLLSESHMRDHPVHPMTDANLVRHLETQLTVPAGLIPHTVVRGGSASIRRAIERLSAEGSSVALVDVISDDDLVAIAEAAVDMPLLTGGSGLGMALASVWRRRGLVSGAGVPAAAAGSEGGVLMLAGSCSEATLRQLTEIERRYGGGIPFDILHLLEEPSSEIDRLYDAILTSIDRRGWALAYSSADRERRRSLVSAADGTWGAETIGRSLEIAQSELAVRAVTDGIIQHLIVAGGETSGSVARALHLQALEIEYELDPGVPVMRPIGRGDLTITLKSGNFGSADFFSKALHRLRAAS